MASAAAFADPAARSIPRTMKPVFSVTPAASPMIKAGAHQVVLHRLAALGHHMAAVLEQFAAVDERPDRRMPQEVVVHLRRLQPLRRQVVEPQHHPDRHRVGVRVQEAASDRPRPG